MSTDSRSVRSGSSSRKKKENKERKRRARRAVRFIEKEPAIHAVPSTSLLTRDEIANLWFSIDELLVIREQVQAQQRLAELGKFDGKIAEYDDYVCMRGIHRESESLERKFYYNEALKALLNEQEQQLFANIRDPEMIRTVVQFWTKKATDEAISAAQRDRREVERLDAKYSSISLPNASRAFYEESKSFMDQTSSIFQPSPIETRGQPRQSDNFDLASIVGDVLSTLETDF